MKVEILGWGCARCRRLEALVREVVAEQAVPVDGVLGVHDLHFWSTGSGNPVLSAHVRVAEATLPDSPALVARLRGLLDEKYGVDHSTVQVERVDCGQGCIERLGAES